MVKKAATEINLQSAIVNEVWGPLKILNQSNSLLSPSLSFPWSHLSALSPLPPFLRPQVASSACSMHPHYLDKHLPSHPRWSPLDFLA
jgi:hypothetical protein